MIHSLSISEYPISAALFNCTGDWVALASREIGQLLVWEWQSEQYIMKQQGHSSEMTCIAYSSDGQFIATGGEDSKVKLWNTQSSFCFVTFSEHTSGVTGIQFSRNKKFLVSSSLDGTVRALASCGHPRPPLPGGCPCGPPAASCAAPVVAPCAPPAFPQPFWSSPLFVCLGN